ncbi:AAA domain-containing protein [Hamiltosporidium tvaerminnensis]|uniref:AAA domain-containing protein n=2 Tax=Hamiltosporidium TaxID=1176354 RepID=A0A4Q9L3U8_9MICR|nr:hypothetical protein LUQ84_000260 [Hamiltosporidium tvaerminnensis]TBU01745.1 AAA domain-containing protein [Hamiltosporidium tvaerminnensis]TBU06761.1 AAA domain-containing protein [Hamiltosporidium magnivora]TBU11647.1 AAA domain-containing protein [Hamiltosporidium tvaerminnensis]TBU12956.1 AAA domain-containing protein [Hamiltosporidium tvaerminnensis]
MKILICGTPGVGKSFISKKLHVDFLWPHIDLSEYIKSKKLYDEYDQRYDTFTFKSKKVRNSLNKYLQPLESYIIDTHTPEIVCKIKFDIIFILKSSLNVLRQRYEIREYSEEKIQENLMCEIMNVVEEDCREIFGNTNVFVFGENCDSIDYNQIVKEINVGI